MNLDRKNAYSYEQSGISNFKCGETYSKLGVLTVCEKNLQEREREQAL